MANNVAITAGAGTLLRTDQNVGSGAHMQVVKLGVSAAGDDTFIPATAANGMTVDVTRVQGSVTVISGVAANLKVDASGANVPVINAPATSLAVSAAAAAPLAVRLSTGAAFIDTFPVSIAATVTVAGTVSIGNTPAVTQSGTWNIGTVATITNPVTVTGTVAVSGTVPVSGTVTANQGTAAAIGNAWVTKITDGVNPCGVTNVGGAFALKVDVIKQVGGGVSQQDRTTFTDGTTFAEPMAGYYKDAATSPGDGQAAALRCSLNRALHVNIRKNDGTELGIAATPLRVDPTGTTTQPVSGTVTGNQGTPAAAANAWPVLPAPPPSGFWKFTITYAANDTAVVLHTPAGGKQVFVQGFMVSMTTNGIVKIFDNSNAAANMLFSANPAAAGNFVVTPAAPVPLSAVNNSLKYSTGAGATGDITVWGYDA